MAELFGSNLDGLFSEISSRLGQATGLMGGDFGQKRDPLERAQAGPSRDPFAGLSYGQDTPLDRYQPQGRDPFAGLSYGQGVMQAFDRIGQAVKDPLAALNGYNPFNQFKGFEDALFNQGQNNARKEQAARDQAIAVATQTGGLTPIDTSAGRGATGLAATDARWGNIDRYSDLIDKYGAEAGIDPDIFRAIIYNESGGNPGAREPNLGASGLLQLMPTVWQGQGDPLDPETNLRLGAGLMREKVAAVRAAYAKNGIQADDRTFARDLSLAWAGHFDYNTGRPNPASRDAVFGQSADQLSTIFLGNYDTLKRARAAQRPAAGVSGINADWAQKANSMLGVPYTFGGIRNTGNPRDGMDCSSFTGWALGLDRGLWNAQAQYDATQRVGGAQAQAGDLVFFQGTTADDPTARPVTHVGIYLGNGKMIHTGGAGGVMVVDLNTPYWQQHLYGYGRVAARGGGSASQNIH